MIFNEISTDKNGGKRLFKKLNLKRTWWILYKTILYIDRFLDI